MTDFLGRIERQDAEAFRRFAVSRLDDSGEPAEYRRPGVPAAVIYRVDHGGQPGWRLRREWPEGSCVEMSLSPMNDVTPPEPSPEPLAGYLERMIEPMDQILDGIDPFSGERFASPAFKKPRT